MLVVVRGVVSGVVRGVVRGYEDFTLNVERNIYA